MPGQYVTKGLPPPPEVSKSTIPMAGLLVDVYGLDELPPAPAPVTCLWLLHPRTRTRARMHDIASRAVHAWHARAGSGAPKRGLVALAFDMPNHGSRMVSESANEAWDKGNEKHALDMVGMVKGGKSDMAALMDVVAGYLGRAVGAHVCLGWSLGGHSAWEAWFGEERIDAAVVVVGCPDMMGLLSKRAKRANLDCGDDFLGSKYFPQDLVTTCLAHDPKAILFGTSPTPTTLPPSSAEQARLRGTLDGRGVRGKRLLLCSGADDTLVPYARARAMVALLRDAAEGWYKDAGLVVENHVYEGVGHRFSKNMVEDAVRFLGDAVAAGPRDRAKM